MAFLQTVPVSCVETHTIVETLYQSPRGHDKSHRMSTKAVVGSSVAVGAAAGIANAGAIYAGAVATANAAGVYGGAATAMALASLGGGAVAAGGGGMAAGISVLVGAAAWPAALVAGSGVLGYGVYRWLRGRGI